MLESIDGMEDVGRCGADDVVSQSGGGPLGGSGEYIREHNYVVLGYPPYVEIIGMTIQK